MLTIIEKWTCDYCGATETREHQLPHFLSEIARRIPEDGWHIVDNTKVACPRHDVIVKDRAESQT